MDVHEILTQATELTESGQHDAALAKLEEGLRAEPEVGALHYLKGVVLQELGDEDGALACYTAATELSPELAAAWVNRGRLLDDDCRSEEAIVCYDAALKLEPGDVVALCNKANSLLSLERFEAALASYDQAAAADPEDARVKLGRSTTLAYLGNVEESNAARPKDTPLDRGEIIQRTRSLGEKTLVLRYWPGKHQQPEILAQIAESLLETVAGCADEPPGLGDGVRIGHGWSVLTIRERRDEWVICEPAFQRNPFDDVMHDVSFTLQTLFMTGLLHNMMKVPPSECTFVNGVAIHAPSLGEQRIGLHRFHETHPENGVSGWLIGPPDEAELKRYWEAGEFEVLPSAMLVHVRHHLIKALSLPPGFTAIFDGHALVSVTDGEGKERWAEDEEEKA